MVTVLNPKIFIISRGVGRTGQVVVGPLTEQVSVLIPVIPEFAVSALSDRAATIGAHQVAIERYETDLFTLHSSQRGGD